MKVTLITGASSGIGEAFAKTLAAEGHNLLLVAWSENKLKTLCEQLAAAHKVKAQYIATDLSDPDACEDLFEETKKRGLQVEWLINNAGFGSMGDFAELDIINELQMIDLNVVALVELTHRFLRPMRERKSGVIINVSSTASFQPVPYMAAYAATKAFVSSFTEAIAEENKPFGVTVTAICPGPTDTNFFTVANALPFAEKGMQSSEQVVDKALKAVKSGKAKAISGFSNAFMAFFGQHVHNKIVAGAIARYLRPKLEARNKK